MPHAIGPVRETLCLPIIGVFLKFKNNLRVMVLNCEHIRELLESVKYYCQETAKLHVLPNYNVWVLVT